MDKFLKFFENKEFVRWVLDPDEQLDNYWKDFLEKNPSENEQIELTRLLILQNRLKKECGSEKETIELFSEIVSKLDKKTKNRVIRRWGLSILKYAAVGLIFFFLGFALFYFGKRDKFNDSARQLAFMQDSNDAHLILGDRENIAIKEKESKIEYGENGKIIINKLDTVQAVSDSRKPEINQLVVPYGKNSSIKLPDGTVAYLNAGSRLIYPSYFEGDKREVYLTGEGFFEVVHNAGMPFIVKTSDLEVEVLGTKFNLSAYPSDKTIETVLVEGKVMLRKTGVRVVNDNYTLEPSQLATYDRKNAETKITRVDITNYVTWHDGYLNFEASDLSSIVLKLERYYKIKIRLDDPDMGERTISGKLKLEDETESVLKVLANTASAKLLKLNESIYVLKSQTN